MHRAGGGGGLIQCIDWVMEREISGFKSGFEDSKSVHRAIENEHLKVRKTKGINILFIRMFVSWNYL